MMRIYIFIYNWSILVDVELQKVGSQHLVIGENLISSALDGLNVIILSKKNVKIGRDSLSFRNLVLPKLRFSTSKGGS